MAPVPQPARCRQEEQPTTSLLELGVGAQQPLDGFQQVGHAVMPGNVLEDVDVLHEGLRRREQGGKAAAQHPWVAGGSRGMAREG